MKGFMLICCLICPILLGFYITEKEGKSDTDAVFNEQFTKDYDATIEQTRIFIEQMHKAESKEALQTALLELRKSYKKIEFLLDYYEPEFVYLYINGGPLPKLHKEDAAIDIIDPNGLQYLDELIYSDESFEAILKETSREIHIIKMHLTRGRQAFSNENMTLKKTIEAMRSAMVRMFTLGLSGFDTPGSANGIYESSSVFQSLDTYLNLINNIHPKKTKEIKAIQDAVYCADDFLKDANYSLEELDYMSFLKSYINPLYKSLADLQTDLGYKLENFRTHAQNYDSENLFDEDFINTNHFAEFTHKDLDNPLSIKLGRYLFYDPALSKNLNMSCASCHDPSKAFSDGQPKSFTNTAGQYTKRNAPGLIDAAYSSRYFWDLRSADLEKQVAHVLDDKLEFNISDKELISRLKESTAYQQLFDECYKDIGGESINRRSISNAIAAYVHSLKSFDSPFDQYVRGESSELDASAIRGFNLFMGKAACATCHFPPAFNGSVPPFYTDAESEVLGMTIGLDTINPILDQDKGRIENGIKGEAYPHFEGSFKTVGIRNSALTAPYFHNGSFNTLEEVMHFYNKGGGAGMGLDVEGQTLALNPLDLSKEEMTDLIKFMESLTDTSNLLLRPDRLPEFDNKPYWNNRGAAVIDD